MASAKSFFTTECGWSQQHKLLKEQKTSCRAPNLLLLVGEHALRLLISLSKCGLICRPLHLHTNANVSFIGLTQLNVKLLNDFSSIHSNLAAHCQDLKKSNYRVTILIFFSLREMNQWRKECGFNSRNSWGHSTSCCHIKSNETAMV